MINNLKNNKAITLIALVITIIVLLILAGVAISMLSGDNGILKQAANAKEKTEEESIIENIKLAEEAARIEGYGNIDEKTLYTELDKTFGVGGYTTAGNLKSGLIITAGEYSYTINGIYMKIPTGFKLASDSGSNIKEGIVIEDNNGNQYVWVPVPEYDEKNCTWGVDYSLVTSETDYTNIENALHEYTTYYRHKADGTETSYTDKWYSGTGLSEEDYTMYKNTMLKSIYKNKGFYIGRYEAGITNNRENHSAIEDDLKPLSKEGEYPLTYVTCREAQELASRINVEKCMSSLMFGVQWDCVMVYLEHYGWELSMDKDVIQEYLRLNSKTWGNYSDSEHILNRGKYAEYASKLNWQSYTTLNNGDKTSSNSILYTTGASDNNSKCKICDIAGNVEEFTLEYSNSNYYPCSMRGGFYFNSGDNYASIRRTNSTSSNVPWVGFRITIY